ncbi:MAG: extracellular solute-binding protein [Caldilineaceae bacterium]
MNRKLISLLSIVVIASLILAACGGGSEPTPTPEPAQAAPTNTPVPADTPTVAPTEAPTEAPAASEPVTTTETVTSTEGVTSTEEMTPTEAITSTEEMTSTEAVTGTETITSSSAAPAEGSALADALAGKFKGTVVTLNGPFVDQDEVKFNDTMKDFEEKTGIDIQYSGSKQFETEIVVKVEGGNAPDIADFPQPGGAASMAAKGKLVDVSTFLPDSQLQTKYIQSWIDMSKMTGPDGKKITAGVWERFNGKSLVWYPKKIFDEAGYKVPTTWDELQALEDQIVSDGDTPWCIGIESGEATGWPATDWMEDFMLRTTSLENYDKWVTGELPFASPEVKNAAEMMAKIWFNDKYVYGGTKAIATTSFSDAPVPMFQDPPKCWLHKQGNFITSFFPPSAQPLVDYDVFYLPPIDEQYGKPFLVAGDLMVMFNDRPEVRAVMEYFTSAEHLKGWLATGGALATQKDVDLSWYGSELERHIAELANAATSVRFDASDQMVKEVNGAFWKEMTNWVSGTKDLDTALKDIDAARPK